MSRQLSYDDLALLGAQLVAAAATQRALGHDTPDGLGIYCQPTDWAAQFVLDVIAAPTSGPEAQAATDRVQAVLDANQSLDLIAEAVTR